MPCAWSPARAPVGIFRATVAVNGGRVPFPSLQAARGTSAAEGAALLQPGPGHPATDVAWADAGGYGPASAPRGSGLIDLVGVTRP